MGRKAKVEEAAQAAEWEEFVERRRASQELALRFSSSTCSLSGALIEALGLTLESRGVRFYRWEHNGEILGKIEAAPEDECDRLVTLSNKGRSGGVGAKSLLPFYGLRIDKSSRRLPVRELDGEFIFQIKDPQR